MSLSGANTGSGLSKDKIHIDLEDDEDRPSNVAPSKGSGRETFEFNDFDGHIDNKENSELRKPRNIDKDEDIRDLKKHIYEL